MRNFKDLRHRSSKTIPSCFPAGKGDDKRERQLQQLFYQGEYQRPFILLITWFGVRATQEGISIRPLRC
jgi:hypothetical protein